jgi:acid phosphatase type 7
MMGLLKCAGTVVVMLIQSTLLHASMPTSYTSPPRKAQKQQKAKLVYGPYLQMVNGQGATLRWRTNIPTDSKVEVGITYEQYTQQVVDPSLTTEHELRITGLKEDTKYFYRFGSSTQVLQKGKDNYFTTAPPPATTRKIRVAVFGDCGTNDKFNRTFSVASYRWYTRGNPAELMLLLGDNAYSDGLDHEYQKTFFRPFSRHLLKNHALFPAPGNHEYANSPARQKDLDIPYYNLFSVPQQGECGGVPSGSESYYSYNWGNIHFVSLDSYGEHDGGTTRLYDTLGAQVQWLKKDLAANRQQWTIVYWHHPPYTMGSHNSDEEMELIKIRENTLRVLERYGADLVLTGHSHNYERSFLLNGYYSREESFAPTAHAVSTSSGRWDGKDNSCPYTTGSNAGKKGTVYVVSGSSGASGQVEKDFPHNAMPFAHHTGGMFYFEVEGNRLDARFIRKNGTIGDQFTLVKDVPSLQSLVVRSGDTATLSAAWNGQHRWSTGATARSITIIPTEDTTLTVQDPKGCLTQTFQVHVKPTGTKLVAPGGQGTYSP